MRRQVVRAAAIGAFGVASALGLAAPAGAQDQHSGVLGSSGSAQDTPLSAETPAPRSAPRQDTGDALPVTGGDIAVTAAAGAALVVGGAVLSRRRRVSTD